MCENGPIIQSRDTSGQTVWLCSECGGVFVIVHACDVHLVVEVEGELFVVGDMGSECVGEVDEGMEVSDERARIAAAWN